MADFAWKSRVKDDKLFYIDNEKGRKMVYITNRQKRLTAITGIIYLAMIALCCAGLFIKGINNMVPIYVFNVAHELLGMAVGYVLYLCCLIDVQKSGSNLKYFIYLLNVSIYALFTDAMSWILEGNPELWRLNYIDNFVLFLCGPLSAFCFWKYISEMLVLNRPFERVLDKVVTYGLAVPMIMRIINVFNGMYFTVLEFGIYKRGPLYILSNLYVLVVLVIVAVTVIVERKQLDTYQLVAVALYLLAPFAAIVLTSAVYGLSVTQSLIMLDMLLMYCILNVSQGREKAAADRDLAMASNIQETILPRIFPYLPEREEFDIYATMTPAKEVGGDFYDFFMIDDDHIAIVIADVSGKGMPAALFMMVARTLIKNQAQSASSDKDPGHIFTEVNNQLCEGNEMELFVTAWLGIVTLSTGHMVYSSAGHEYPALSKNGKDFVIRTERNMPPLATMEGLKFKTGEVDLEHGDTLYIYTDGVAEATDAAGELYGIDRMLDALNKNPSSDLKKIDTRVRASIDKFVGDAPQFDDITMLTFRYTG